MVCGGGGGDMSKFDSPVGVGGGEGTAAAIKIDMVKNYTWCR